MTDGYSPNSSRLGGLRIKILRSFRLPEKLLWKIDGWRHPTFRKFTVGHAKGDPHGSSGRIGKATGDGSQLGPNLPPSPKIKLLISKEFCGLS